MSEPKKTGRPRKEVDWDKVDKMCAIHCTGEEQASLLDMSYDTLERRCREEKGVSFAEYFKQKAADGKMSLRRKQFTTAMDGNTTMLVWLGKNWLGQSDTPNEGNTDLETYFVDSRKDDTD